jgi:hypothetical protein
MLVVPQVSQQPVPGRGMRACGRKARRGEKHRHRHHHGTHLARHRTQPNAGCGSSTGSVHPPSSSRFISARPDIGSARARLAHAQPVRIGVGCGCEPVGDRSRLPQVPMLVHHGPPPQCLRALHIRPSTLAISERGSGLNRSPFRVCCIFGAYFVVSKRKYPARAPPLATPLPLMLPP